MNKSGVALILVLVVIALLTVLIIEFNYISRVESSIVGNWKNERRAYFLAKGGVNLGIYLLKMDDPRNDSLIEDWAKAIPPLPVDGGSIQLEISDEDGKINVNRLIEKGNLSTRLGEATMRLFQFFDIEPRVFPPLLGYLSEDTIVNEPFDTKSQLLEFPGLDNLVDFLTIYSPGRININTAPLPVIQSLSGEMNEELAQSIINYRSDTPFRNVGQLSRVPGVTDGIVRDVNNIGTVKSNFFTVKSIALVGESRKEVVAVVERTKKGMDIVYWRSGF
jgi:general secretion pathway protein K